MRKLWLLVLVPSLVAFGGIAQASDFLSPLSGDEEVPARDTKARGQAIYKVSDDGLSIHYKLIVANIDNIIQAHIHLAPKGVNGGIVVFLHELVPPGGGPSSGLIREGTITAANLIGALAGHPLSDLIAQMQAGNAYTNVHTNDGISPTNTGPGDFPGGEIRGQIRAGE